jgi:membrane protein
MKAPEVPPVLRPFVGAGRRMFDYELTGRAAELAYYSMLALFPALIVLLGAVGLLAGQDDVQKLVQAVSDTSSADTGQSVQGAIDGIATRDTGAGFAIGGGLITTAYSASLYTAAFTRGAAAARGHLAEKVPWKRRLWLMPVTVAALLGLGIALALLLLTTGAVEDVASAVGLGGVTKTLLELLRYPVLVGVMFLLVYGLFRLTGRGEHESRRPSLGAIVAVSAWLIASLGFALYTATLASYESTYGALSGVVSFLVWLWITNLVLLYGVALDAELRGEDPHNPADADPVRLPGQHLP